MAKVIHLPGARPADAGEARVLQHLEAALPATYTLIPNVEIVQLGYPAFEYDLIAIAPHAVYVVEVKRWLGGIRGDDYGWMVAGQHRRQNPWPTANNKARVLKSQIERRQPHCRPAWVEAVVAIADDQGALDLRGVCRERVFRYTDLPAFLTDPTALGERAGDLRPLRAYLEKAIQEAGHGRPAAVLRFGDYEVEETLARRDAVSEFLARNTLLRGDVKVRLRVFSYDPYVPPDVQAHRQECIRRESEVLQQIGRHPNLIALQAFFTDPNDPNLFVEVTDWSETGVLRGLMNAEAPLSLERKLELAQGIAAGLQAAHEAGVIHRDVRPENILIGRDEQPRLMNFDHARIALPGALTVGPLKPDPDVPRAYQAPELLNPIIPLTPAADLYSLGQILFEMLAGQPLYEKPEDALSGTTTLGAPGEYVADVPAAINALVQQLLHRDARRRPQSAAEVITVLRALREKPSGTVIETPAPEPAPPPPPEREPAQFLVNEVIDGKYQVQQVLDAGGSGRVYKVYDPIRDRILALKLFEATALSLEFLKREVRTLEQIRHPHIVRFQGWGKLAERFYLLTDFVEGEDLHAYTMPDRRLPVRDAVNLVLQLLAALGDIHPDVERLTALREKMAAGEIDEAEYAEFGRLQESGILHRDIKPANLMLSVAGLVLVDFNIAAQAGQAGRTYVGTPGYMLPEVGLLPWSADGDLFATGIVLYELVTGHHPYPDGQPSAETPPTDPRIYVPELHPALAEILVRAASCDATLRYHSARRFKRDLESLEGVYLQAVDVTPRFGGLTLAPGEADKPNSNPYVTRFLRLYSQAARDNSGTRGLDEIARLTYVPTRLDRLLRPAVLDGRYRLVIITGNAGDGKTAFIKQLEEVAGAQTVLHPTDNSGVFTYNGIRFVTNYDGSQDEGAERANDLVLTEFFAPFADAALDQAPSERAVHVIAINEGRLIDFFGATPGARVGGAAGFSRLGALLARFFERDHDNAALPDWLLVVDLNRRSVVARDPAADNLSIFERQLAALLKPEFWEACWRCAWRERCPIHYNVRALSDPASGAEVRERLRTLFEIVHLRRQLHITMRDLRSALAWVLFHDLDCDAIARLAEGHTPPETWLAFLYHQALAADGRPPEGRGDDRLVALLRQIDPAQIANPTADRTLHFQELRGLARLAFAERPALAEAWLEDWQLPRGWEALQHPEIARQVQARHAAARRIAYFERRDAGWEAMLPYQNFARFRARTQAPSPELLEMLATELVEGISLAEGARHPALAREYVFLRAGQAEKVKIKSFRLFPRAAFAARVPSGASGPYLEVTPDQIVFSYAAPDTPNSRAELLISLDLLELLMQVREGFTPSLDDIQGFFINLVVFKNALAHLPYRHAILTRNDRQFYEVRLDDRAVIALQQWDEGRMKEGKDEVSA